MVLPIPMRLIKRFPGYLPFLILLRPLLRELVPVTIRFPGLIVHLSGVGVDSEQRRLGEPRPFAVRQCRAEEFEVIDRPLHHEVDFGPRDLLAC